MVNTLMLIVVAIIGFFCLVLAYITMRDLHEQKEALEDIRGLYTAFLKYTDRTTSWESMQDRKMNEALALLRSTYEKCSDTDTSVYEACKTAMEILERLRDMNEGYSEFYDKLLEIEKASYEQMESIKSSIDDLWEDEEDEDYALAVDTIAGLLYAIAAFDGEDNDALEDIRETYISLFGEETWDRVYDVCRVHKPEEEVLED